MGMDDRTVNQTAIYNIHPLLLVDVASPLPSVVPNQK